MQHNKKNPLLALLTLSLGALGVVYGDIGTSVLYAMNEIFFGHHPVALDTTSIFGSISLAIWALTIVVAFKYIFFVLRADYNKEGGVFALVGLLKKFPESKVAVFLSGALLIVAAGLLFGDGLITPSISVLAAVEGLGVAAPSLSKFIIPITIVILTVLFAFQYKGTSKVGMIFGPIVLAWFLSLAALGLSYFVKNPEILHAFNPVYAVNFLMVIGVKKALFVMGSIMLVVTGGEALYADMGHFGLKPIRISWFSVVYPALLLNYLGQGAFLLSGAEILNKNIFFSMVPTPIIFPMVILATFATVIASQALISGVFSLTTQGMALGFLPKMSVVHTNEHHEGQIYVPFINWALYLGCILLVITFRSSSNLASAYGLAVAGDMLITTLSMIVLSSLYWKWKPLQTFGLFIPLLALDIVFLTANSLKFFSGGYVPFGIGVTMFTVMKTWEWGKAHLLAAYQSRAEHTVDELLIKHKGQKVYTKRALLILTPEIPTSKEDKIPGLMQVFLDQHAYTPQHVIFLKIETVKTPHVEGPRYIKSVFENSVNHGTVASIVAQFGYMETPNVEKILADIKHDASLLVDSPTIEWIIFVGRERLLQKETPHKHLGLFKKLRLALFKILHKNTPPSYMYFGLGDELHLSTAVIPVKM